MSVCASSMNRMIGVGEAFTSSMTERRRFSNSPLTPAPACSKPRSSVRSCTFFKRVGHVAGGDPQCKTFDHGRLADARFAGQDRVVLAAARENIDDLAHFGVAAQHRIDLFLAGQLGQIRGELIERRRFGIGRDRAARRRPPRRRSAAPGLLRGFGRFGGERRQVAFQLLGGNLRQLGRAVANRPERFRSANSAVSTWPERTAGCCISTRQAPRLRASDRSPRATIPERGRCRSSSASSDFVSSRFTFEASIS